MIKVGPQFGPRGTSWDHKGRTEISQIFISCSQSRINSIHFAYVEGGNKIVLSDTIGGGGEGTTLMKTITLHYPSEYITGLSGGCQGSYGGPYLSSITFHTNKATYGPFVPGAPDNSGKVTNFNYQVGGAKFYGFFGTYMSGGIESIGYYVKPKSHCILHEPETKSSRELTAMPKRGVKVVDRSGARTELNDKSLREMTKILKERLM